MFLLFYHTYKTKKKNKNSHSYCTSPSLQAHVFQSQTVPLNFVLFPLMLPSLSLSLSMNGELASIYILSPDLVLWLLLICQIFDQKMYWFHLTHIGYLQTVQVWSVKLIDCFQKQWWKVTNVNKGNHSLLHLIRGFMVELFDVVLMGKCFKWEKSTLAVCWPQKQNNNNKKEGGGVGGGGERKVQM